METSSGPPSLRDRLAGLRVRLGARAAGWWRVDGGRLVLVAFDAAPDMPAEVSEEFVAATTSLPLARTDLGVVRAAVTGDVAVSRSDGVPSDFGSGFWLTRFGAARSVAVPLPDALGIVVRIVSVALGPEPTDAVVADLVRVAAGSSPE